MTFEAYINPDFGTAEKIVFFIAAFLGVAVCVFLIVTAARIHAGKEDFPERAGNRVQRFYEMIISGASVMSFACAELRNTNTITTVENRIVNFFIICNAFG